MNSMIALGYMPTSVDKAAGLMALGSEDAKKNFSEIISENMKNVILRGVMIFGEEDNLYFLFAVDESAAANAKDLNEHLYQFFDEEYVKDISNRLNIVINVDDDGGYTAAVIPNPEVTIKRLKTRHEYEELHLVMPLIHVCSQRYEESYVSMMRDKIENKKLKFGFIDVNDIERVSKKETFEEADMIGIEMVLGFNDFPEAKITFTNEHDDEGPGILYAAINKVKELIGDRKDTKFTLMIV